MHSATANNFPPSDDSKLHVFVPAYSKSPGRAREEIDRILVWHGLIKSLEDLFGELRETM